MAAIMSARYLSTERFAEAIGESVSAAQQLLLGHKAVDGDIAQRLSDCLGSSPTFWMSRETQYRADCKRIREREEAAAREAWIKQFPIRDMVTLGWLREAQSVGEMVDGCLEFFGVSDVPGWQTKYGGAVATAAFRMSRSIKASPWAVSAWLRQAELVSQRIPCSQWDPEAFKARLQNVRRLTWQKDPVTFLPMLRQLCAEVGVAVVVARTPKGCPASGATCFLSPEKAMMVLSFRYRSDDQFWFTFFHESAHLLLHGRDAIFLEDDSDTTLDEENEANEFAERIILPFDRLEEFNFLSLDKDSILRFSRSVGVAPGLIVGQLQYRKRVASDRMNWLKRRYDWEQIEIDGFTL